MIRYFACAFAVASATLLPGLAAATARGVVQVAMLESHGPRALPEVSAFSPHNVENVALSVGRYLSPTVIHGPSYFSALRRYDRQQWRDHKRLQGYGFGFDWSTKSQ